MTLRIRNWDKWQSYRKDRGQPPWIKIHRQLMRDPNWVSLTDAQRGQLVAIWMLAADRNGVIPASAALIRKLCFMDSEPNLNLFIEKEFLDGCQDGVTVTPIRRQVDQPEESRGETETEAESLSEPSSDPQPKAGNSRKRVSYPPEFESFWKDYPTDPLQSKKEAFTAWNRLGPDDRTQAARAAPAFRRYCAENPDYRPVHACRFLSQRRFDGFAVSSSSGPPAGLNAEERAKWVREQMERESAEKSRGINESGNLLEGGERFRAAG